MNFYRNPESPITNWYRNRGYDFTITSSTAFDHNELFAAYLSRPNVRQPILTQYCDGRRVSCPDWMTQWGSKELGDQGYSPIEILRYFYGDDMYINTAEEISGIPDRRSLSGASEDHGGRYLWSGYRRSRERISVCVRTSGDGKGGLSYMV